jgi:hypothetical protein
LPLLKIIILYYIQSIKKSAKPSAFSAVNNTDEQNVTADNLVVPVLYPDEIFDLNNEYDPITD